MQFSSEVQKQWAEINKLKQERQAIVLAHYYQRPEIQEIADFVGDSLELSRLAAKTDAKVIVFCGVHFMAESAAILSPEKTVLLPVIKAGCAMADMVTAESLRAKKESMPNAVVVTYVNSSAEVKAESDICCTSANVVKVLQSIPEDKEILFVPDKNLGQYAAQRANRKVTVWAGECPIHDNLTVDDLRAAKERYPEAKVLVHPECQPNLLPLADVVSSTSGLLRFAQESSAKQFIVATEEGILYQMRKQNPDKEFHLVHDKMVCPDMKYTTLSDVQHVLASMDNQITVPEEIRERALLSLERMLAI